MREAETIKRGGHPHEDHDVRRRHDRRVVQTDGA